MNLNKNNDAAAPATRKPPTNPTGSGGFPKGQSGNPGGRARMPAKIRDMLEAKAGDAVNVIVKNLGDGDPRISLRAAELLLDRTYGKPQQAEEPISFELPDDTGNASGLVVLHGSLLRATACGDVAVSHAREMSGLFENHRKLVETAELEARIAKLEERQKGAPW